MAINKVVYGNNTLMDITDTTAEAGDVLSGQVFYTANGTRTVGSGSGPTDVQINSTSITSSGTADIKAEGTYNASTNKLITKSHLDSTVGNYLPKEAQTGNHHLYIMPTSYSTTQQGLSIQATYDDGSPGGMCGIDVQSFYDSQSSSNKQSIRLYSTSGTNIIVEDNKTTIKNVPTPTSNNDAANKKYVDDSLSGAATDVQINSTSIVSSGVANLATEGTYNASTNKLTTKNYVDDIVGNIESLLGGI